MRNIVEESLDVEVDHPGTSPAPLLAPLHRIQRRPARTIAVRVGMEKWLHQRLQNHRRSGLRYPVRDPGDGGFILPLLQWRFGVWGWGGLGWRCGWGRGGWGGGFSGW